MMYYITKSYVLQFCPREDIDNAKLSKYGNDEENLF